MEADSHSSGQRSEAWFRALMEQSPLSTQVFSPDGRTIQVNRAWEKLWGAKLEDLADYNILEDEQLVTRGTMPYIRRGFAGEALPIPPVWYDPNDTRPGVSTREDPRRWVRAFIHPIKDPCGKVTEIVLIHEDMTAQKLAEEQLRESEQRFSRFMQHLPGLAWVKDVDGRYIYANEAAVAAFGTTTDHLYGHTDGDLFPPDTAEQFRRNDERVRESAIGLQVIETLRHPDGVVHHSLVSKFPIPGCSDRPALVGGMAIDITDLNETQIALRISEERLRMALEAGRMGVWEWNLRTNQLWWSDNLEPIHGLPPGGFGGTIEHFDQLIHPEDRDRVQKAISDSIQGRTDFDIEFRNLWPDGTTHWIGGKGRVFCDDQGPARMMGVGMDITRRREVELQREQLLIRLKSEQDRLQVALLERERAEEALRDADRRKNEFLATLAHELRNPLAPIRNSLKLLQMAGDDVELQSQARAIMERQLQQMVRLIDDLLDLSRITRNRLELRREPFELAAAVQSAVESVRPLIDSFNHQLTIELPDKPVFLFADHARLSQILSNLLNNAAKYTNRGGQIRLQATREGDHVTIRVQDNGIGIAAEHIPGLFAMFSQISTALERSQGGLGIGLALVRSLVEMHGGTISVQSPGPGHGTEFLVRLPVLTRPTPAAAISRLQLSHPQCRRRILIVDDNRDGADSLALTLRVAGHETHSAYDGHEALHAADWFRPDAVLLDIGLPNLNGYEVARRLRQGPFGPNLLLVAITGWGKPADKRQAREAGFDHHLTKPVDHELLERLLVADQS